MIDAAPTGTARAPGYIGYHRSDRAVARLRRRYARERRFKTYGLVAVLIAMGMLAFILVDIVSKGYSAFVQTKVELEVFLDPAELDAGGDRAALMGANYQGLANEALYRLFPEATDRRERRALRDLLSPAAGYELREMVLDDPGLIGQTVAVALTLSDQVDQHHKGRTGSGLSDDQIAAYERLEEAGLVAARFNTAFFTSADSRDPEMAGIWGAVKGSFFTLLVTLAISFPIGIAAAVYLEEFAPRNRLTDFIEVNINNLAAVPSIVFGLLGLAVFIQTFGMPRSAPLVGGLVLALMTLPVIIIAARAALKAVPPSIREAALGMGASPLQTVLHHVLPLAMPGIMTGTIIGMARALGETAPLLMIGMVAFIVTPPSGFTDASTVLPVQIFIWADSPERAFVERTSAGIMVLLAFLIAMNGLAVWLRKRFERRW
jgi:phosphate transport system permease protein